MAKTYTVQAGSRYTLNLLAEAGAGSLATVFQSLTAGADIFVERSIYWGNNFEGSTGATAIKDLSTSWVFAEGAAATTIAALLAGLVPLRPDDAVACIVSGGNIDVTLLERIIARGLVADGRLARLSVTVADRPGQLGRLTRIVAEEGANVLEVAHRRAFADISVRDVDIALHLETRGRGHMDAVLARLRAEGFVVREDD